MKHSLLLLALTFVSGQCFSQNLDSLRTVKLVDSLLTSAKTLSQTRKNGDALPLAQKALDISKNTWGEDNIWYAASLHRLAVVYQGLYDFDKAEELYRKAIDLRAKLLGKDHPDYAGTLNNLAFLYYQKGDYSNAESFLLEGAAIREKVLGKEHIEYAGSLNNLGNLYRNKGEYSKAESRYLESLAIKAKVLGKEHPDYAASLNNFANLFFDKGDYSKAELLYLESKEIREKTLGKEHLDYASSLVNLANFYYLIGDEIKVEPLFLEAIQIYDKTLDKKHLNYAWPLDGLAKLRRDQGNYAEAESLFVEALAIWEQSLGKAHHEYAGTLNNLAMMYREKGDLDKAEVLYVEAIEIINKSLGKEHTDYASYLHNLASIYLIKGNFTDAEPLYLEALDIWTNTFGNEHSNWASTLHELTLLYQITNRTSEASEYFLRVNELNRQLIKKSSAYSSESQVLAYMQKFDKTLAQFYSFSQTYPNPELSRASFDNALFYNNYLLENARYLTRSIEGADSLTNDTYERWQGCHRRLANEYSKPITARKYVAAIEAEAEGYEKMLTRNLIAFSKSRQIIHWKDIQEHLESGEVALEFIHYRHYTPWKTDSTMYAALLLSNSTEQPQFIPLFEQKQLDTLLQTSGGRKADYVNSLYAVAERGIIVVGKPQKTLYELLWKPLEASLKGVHTVYFAPSGLLHRLNLGAIPIGVEETLADHYNLVELGSTRQLVVPNSIKIGNSNALLFGGVQYDMDSTTIASNFKKTDHTDVATRGDFSLNVVDSTLRIGTWNYLKWTEKEVGNLVPILNAGNLNPISLKGSAATEEAFKNIGKNDTSPRILHIATHGYFFPDPKQEATKRLGEAEPVFKISEHPMIRSGLLLAGANHAWKTGKPLKPGMEDGILTAYEISQMNLSNTELVVLSACETGLGDIQGNEGVYGLQRAFKIAGAKYLIMSLWQVPDKQTSLLMTTFYKKWLEDKMTIPEAFRAAQKELREAGLDPYQWAGFVLVE